MEQRYKVVVFDLDGTLLDTSEGVLASVVNTINKFGLKELSEAELKKFIGPPIQVSFARTYGLEGDIIQELANAFRDDYKDVNILKAVPYDGIFDVFQRIREADMKPAVATYKRQDYALKVLRHFGFDKYSDVMYGADNENKLTKSDIIRNALRDSGVTDLRDAVMVGDSDNDAIGARELGIDFIGVTYGFGFSSDDDVNQFPNVGIAHNTEEILKVLSI